MATLTWEQTGDRFGHKIWITYTTSHTNGVFTLTVNNLSYVLTGTQDISQITYQNVEIAFAGTVIHNTGAIAILKTQSTSTIGKSKTVSQTTASQSKTLSLKPDNNAAATATITIPALATYTVSYNANGGSGTVANQTKTESQTLTLRANSYTRTNYSFYHWNTKSDNSGTSYGNSSGGGSYTANAAATMYAIWNPIISYNANGGTGTVSSQTKTYGASLTLRTNSYTRSGYSFYHWNTKADNSGTSYGNSSGGGTYTANTATTLYAIWNAQIAYNANGGTGAPETQTKTFGSTLNLQSATPTRTGYTFSKWNSAANGSGTDYTPSQTLAANDNTAKTLYAQWTANTYTISFNANGGVGAPSSISKIYGQSVTLPTAKPARVGHTFLGWADSQGATTAQWLAGANFSEAISADTTLYAVWRDDYESPSITTLRAYRCGFELTADTESIEGKVYYTHSYSYALTEDETVNPSKTYYVYDSQEDEYVEVAEPVDADIATYYERSDIYTSVSEPDVSEISTYYELIDDDEAGYARVEATWSIDTTVDEGVTNTATMTGTITPEGQQAQSITFQSGYQGTAGNAVALVEGLDVDTQYTVTVTVTDIKGASMATSRTVLLLRAFYIFDFGSQGNAVGIGRAAPQSGMEVGYRATFDDEVNLYDELQFNGEQAYPTFTRSSWSTTSDQTTLPVTPCFVLDTTDEVLYWCDEQSITKMSGVAGVKGDAEATYRTGDVNLTPANIGALALIGGTLTGDLTMNGDTLDADGYLKYISARAEVKGNPGGDLNDMLPGECWWGSNFTNAPSTNWFMVLRQGDYQTAYGYNGNAGVPLVHVRSHVNSVWQPWMRCMNAHGDTVDGTISRNITGGISYIASWNDDASLIRLTKTEGSDLWRPILALRTKGGGGWAIGNYNNESLEFVYGSSANIGSQTNSTLKISFTESGVGYFGGLVTNPGSNGNYSEGIRINRATSGWACVPIGGAANSTNGTADYQWFIGTPPTSNGRELRIGHNSSAARTRFYASANNNNVGLKLGGPLDFIDGTALPNASTSTDFYATGINAFANGGTLKYKGLADMQSWLGTHNAANLTSGTLPNARLSDGGWVKLNDYVYCRIRAGFCSVIGDGLGSKTVKSTGTDVGTLPAGARPTRAQEGSGTSTTNNCVQWAVKTTGVVTIWRWGGDNGYWAFVATYPI